MIPIFIPSICTHPEMNRIELGRATCPVGIVDLQGPVESTRQARIFTVRFRPAAGIARSANLPQATGEPQMCLHHCTYPSHIRTGKTVPTARQVEDMQPVRRSGSRSDKRVCIGKEVHAGKDGSRADRGRFPLCCTHWTDTYQMDAGRMLKPPGPMEDALLTCLRDGGVQ